MTRLATIITACLFASCVVAAWAAVPRRSEPVVDNFAALEWNVYYAEENGEVRVRQLLGMDEGNVITFWRLGKPGMYPRKDWKRGDWYSVFQDGDVLREVRGKSFDEVWLPDDREIQQRNLVPKEARRELTSPNFYLKAEWRAAKAKWEGIRQ